jgi:hypothetical protein
VSAPRSQAEHLRWQAGWCRKLGSQLYGHLLERAADDVEAGGPASRALEDRDASQRSMLGLRLMGSVHRLVLQGDAPDLARVYPSTGGRADTEVAWRAFSALLEERWEDVGRGIERPVQTNEVGRAGALIGGFLEVARATGKPLRVLEVGASAGLNLRWDRFSYEARGETWGPPDSPVRLCSFNGDVPLPFDVTARVAERAGCDTDPVDPTTEDGRLTLLSYLWADQIARVRLLRAALEVAAEVPVPSRGPVPSSGSPSTSGRRPAWRRSSSIRSSCSTWPRKTETRWRRYCARRGRRRRWRRPWPGCGWSRVVRKQRSDSPHGLVATSSSLPPRATTGGTSGGSVSMPRVERPVARSRCLAWNARRADSVTAPGPLTAPGPRSRRAPSRPATGRHRRPRSDARARRSTWRGSQHGYEDPTGTT